MFVLETHGRSIQFFGSLWPCISPLWVYIWSFLFRSGASTRLRPNPQNVASEKIQATGVTDGPNVGMLFKAEEAEYFFVGRNQMFFCAQKISVSDVIDYHKFMLQDIWRVLLRSS